METAYFQAAVLVRFEEIHLVSVIEMYKQFTLAEILCMWPFSGRFSLL